MPQMTIQTGSTAAPVPATGRTRKMRHQRMVSLRTPMPLGLVTLRHDVPEWLGHDVPDFQTQPKTDTTSKVVLAPREVETTTRRA
jgi:hypothetical protein